jgi:hypothetical protein
MPSTSSALCGGNTGNFAFVFALHQLLSPDVDVVSWEANPEMVREKYDAIVFACANQLGPHTDLGLAGRPAGRRWIGRSSRSDWARKPSMPRNLSR